MSSEDPIFLLGAARSGTSLTYKTLSLHPDVAFISNWVARYPAFPALGGLNRVARSMPNRMREVWFGAKGDNAYVYGSRRRTVDRLFPMPAEAEQLYKRCGIPELPDDAPATDADLAKLRAAFHLIRKSADGERLLTKRVADNRRIPTLLAAFPEASFIEIVRDGRAVAASLRKVDWWDDHTLFWAGATPRQLEAQGQDPWAIAGRNWAEEVAEVRAGSASIPEGQLISVRYEDFVANPVDTLHTLSAFVGLGSDTQFTEAIKSISFPNKNEAWRDRISSEAIRTVEAAQQSELAHYGY